MSDTLPDAGDRPLAPVPARAIARREVRRRAGFTLLELLVVITMMIFITTIAVVNYFGVMRTGGYAAVSNDVFNMLLMARQRACLDNKPVYFYLLDSTNYVIQEAFGTIAGISPMTDSDGYNVYYDKYEDLSSYSGTNVNMSILNMDRPGSVALVKAIKGGIIANGGTNPVTGEKYDIPAYSLHLQPTGTWQPGDRYGAELFARQMLPKGFVFEPDPLSVAQNQRVVVFLADGSVDTVNGLSTVVVREKIGSAATNRVTFTIQPNGKVHQGK